MYNFNHNLTIRDTKFIKFCNYLSKIMFHDEPMNPGANNIMM